MPIANVRGANINYEVLGTSGPWVALSPGGRRALEHRHGQVGRGRVTRGRVD